MSSFCEIYSGFLDGFYGIVAFVWSTEILQQIILALIASAVFYFIVVYFPQKNKNRIAKDFLIKTYKNTKISILEKLLGYLNKYAKGDDIRESILNYSFVKSLIGRDDQYSIMNYDDSESFRYLNIQILYELDILKSTLLQIVSFDFIGKNEYCYGRVNNLIRWIDQFRHLYDTLYRDDDDFDFSKTFCNLIVSEFVCGFSIVDEPREKDDFVDVIECAYKSDLFLYKIYLFNKRCKERLKMLIKMPKAD